MKITLGQPFSTSHNPDIIDHYPTLATKTLEKHAHILTATYCLHGFTCMWLSQCGFWRASGSGKLRWTPVQEYQRSLPLGARNASSHSLAKIERILASSMPLLCRKPAVNKPPTVNIAIKWKHASWNHCVFNWATWAICIIIKRCSAKLANCIQKTWKKSDVRTLALFIDQKGLLATNACTHHLSTSLSLSLSLFICSHQNYKPTGKMQSCITVRTHTQT